MTASEKVWDQKFAGRGKRRVTVALLLTGKDTTKSRWVTGYAPSVTTVLSETASEASKKETLWLGVRRIQGRKKRLLSVALSSMQSMEHYLADGVKES
jgi:hypothetical protein